MSAREAHLEGLTPLYDCEYRLRTKSGDWKWIYSRGAVVEWDSTGKPLRMSGTILDIHDRKVTQEKLARAHEELEKQVIRRTTDLARITRDLRREVRIREKAMEDLRKSEALLKEAQRVAHIGHWELESPDGTPTWSEEIFHVFGLDPAKGEPSFAGLREFIHPQDWELLERSIRALSSEGVPYDIEFRLTRPDNTVRWMSCKGSPSKNAKGEVIRLFGTSQDITERKQAKKSFKRVKPLSGRYCRELLSVSAKSLKAGSWVGSIKN